MGYPQELMVGAVEGLNTTVFTTAQPLQTAANVYGSVRAHMPFYVHRMTVRVSTAVNDSTAAVLELQKVTVGDVTSSLATGTVPNGTGANKVLYFNCTPTKIGVGDKLQFKLKTAAAPGGTPAGAGFLGFYGTFHPEEMTNETNAISI